MVTTYIENLLVVHASLTRLDSWVLGLIVGILEHVLEQNSLKSKTNSSTAPQFYITGATVAYMWLSWITTTTSSYLAKCWLIVEPGTAVAMSTCTDLEVEGAVYPKKGKLMCIS